LCVGYQLVENGLTIFVNTVLVGHDIFHQDSAVLADLTVGKFAFHIAAACTVVNCARIRPSLPAIA
jgi:hypothetical protein